MGTNLMNTDVKKNGSVWEPANGIFSGLLMLASYLFKNAKKRGKELDPAKTEVYEDGEIDYSPLPENDLQKLRDRHWGGIYAAKYHGFMAKLQARLNQAGDDAIKGEQAVSKDWQGLLEYDPALFGRPSGKGEGTKPCLTLDEIKHLANFRFEVWAGGYNWLKSNGDAAIAINERINKILTYYQGKLAVNKVIIITHSMGGLVARSLVSPQGKGLNKAGKVLGVIHGAMPANGAAETYISMRQGESGYLSPVLGRDAQEVGAVMAMAQGSLELLPFDNGNYRLTNDWQGGESSSKWLRYGEQGNQILPGSKGACDEIYAADTWYGLLPQVNLDKLQEINKERDQKEAKKALPPDANDRQFGVKDQSTTVRKDFETVIHNVKTFHMQITSVYHQDSFAFWGFEKTLPTMAGVDWQPYNGWWHPSASTTLDNGEGKTYDGQQWRKLKVIEEPGDGTVPFASWREDRYLMRICFVQGQGVAPGVHKGFGHQKAFANEQALAVSMYAIAKLVQQVSVPGSCP